MPVDTRDGKLVKSMRDYLERSDYAGWVRSGGEVRVLRNAVTEADNPKVPKLRCYGLATDRYVRRETLRSIIEKEFCVGAARHGSYSRRYRPGTMDDVTISVKAERAHGKAHCVKHLLGAITDGCDARNPLGNPANYKGGGEVALDDFRYYIEPQVLLRAPARLGMAGGCEWESTGKDSRASFSLWGRGWASDDFGAAIQERLTPYGIDEWRFDYAFEEEDSREWSANFRTDIKQKRHVEGALKAAGAPGGIACRGSG